VHHYVSDKVGMLEYQISLPAIVSYKAFGSFIGGSSPQITVSVKEQFVNAGFMFNKRLRAAQVTGTRGNIKASNLPITPSAEENKLRAIWVKRSRIDGEVLDPPRMTLEDMEPLTRGDTEDYDLRICSARYKDILTCDSGAED